MKKVAFFASDNYEGSGAFRSLTALAKILQDKYNVKVKIYLPSSGSGEHLLKKNHLNYIIIPSYDWIIRIDEGSSLIGKIKWIIKRIINIWAIFRIKKDLKNFKPDIVHINTSYGYVGAIAANKLKIPVVWHIREFLEEDQNCRFRDKKKAYRVINKSDKIIAISKSVRKKYLPIFGDKVITIYNGIDSTKYYSTHDLFANGNYLLSVGGLYPGKGHELIIKALGILRSDGVKNFKYRIVGQGSEEKKLKKLVDKEKLTNQVEFCGFSKDTEKFYKNSDIFILGSVSEAFGRVTVEAMMNGLIVLGRNSAGTAEILENGKYGLLFSNKKDLATKLKNILSNKKKAKTLAISGQNMVLNRYTAERNADQVYEIYKKILKKRK